MTELDARIQSALESLRQAKRSREFDVVQYISAFQQSAYDKAKSVLELLAAQRILSSLRPVFLSIGGGDGAELEHLLQNSQATTGVLLEGSRPLADSARERARQLPGGKEMTIFEGDAKETIREGVTRANALVAAGHGDYVCEAMKYSAASAGIRIDQLNQIEWQIARSFCTRRNPRCDGPFLPERPIDPELECLAQRVHGCPIRSDCRGATDPELRSIVDPRSASPYY
jgi:hypothetical protein